MNSKRSGSTDIASLQPACPSVLATDVDAAQPPHTCGEKTLSHSISCLRMIAQNRLREQLDFNLPYILNCGNCGAIFATFDVQELHCSIFVQNLSGDAAAKRATPSILAPGWIWLILEFTDSQMRDSKSTSKPLMAAECPPWWGTNVR